MSDRTAERRPRTTGLDLHLGRLDGNVKASLMDAVRDAIRAGWLASGTRLPSSRDLAADLQVARNTVVRVYSELINEGWLTGLQGSGTEVSQQVAEFVGERPRPADTRSPSSPPSKPATSRRCRPTSSTPSAPRCRSPG
ncbi:winged helix-turn-helix domain-containing protein [Amycolatopsis sp. NPDC048633]|uniref:winged helix-turn-helix domain-containing protein n=1 Tax=Amycolatopsis sp. NPDC048633 TaxID=3157095 RepID=UPI0033D5794A